MKRNEEKQKASYLPSMRYSIYPLMTGNEDQHGIEMIPQDEFDWLGFADARLNYA
jgi:hypothetical protein